jgi:hypothetical protein
MEGGVKKVVYDGPPKREVEYHSLAEMDALLAKMIRHVQSEAGSPQRRLVKTKKGFR